MSTVFFGTRMISNVILLRIFRLLFLKNLIPHALLNYTIRVQLVRMAGIRRSYSLRGIIVTFYTIPGAIKNEIGGS
jgi:hypothetical protein